MREQAVQKAIRYGLVMTLFFGASSFALASAAQEAAAPPAQATEVAPPAAATPTSSSVGEEASGSAATLKTAAKIPLGMVGYDTEGKRGWLHTVRKGETLWHITDAYFGTPWIWPSVWRDNSATIVNPHRINPGDTLWITADQIRPVTAAEAEALLAGKPAAGQAQDASAKYILPEDQIPDDVLYFSSAENTDFIAKEIIEASATIVSTRALAHSLGEDDTIIIGRGQGRVRVGDQLSIFRNVGEVHYPDSNRIFGQMMDFLGWAEVTAVYEETSEAKIRSARSEISVGDILVPRAKPVQNIKLIAPVQHVTGQIVAMQDKRLNVLVDDVAYLDKGEAAGLQVGVTLEIVRKLKVAPDRGTDEMIPRKTPDIVVGTMVVVSTRPESAVALIRTGEHHFIIGDYYRTVGTN